MEFERSVDPDSSSASSPAGSSSDAYDSSSRASSDAYDFERLEGSVETLLRDHAQLSAEYEALIFELVERQQKIATLEAELVTERSRRADAVQVVDRVLDRVASIESSLAGEAPTAAANGASGSQRSGRRADAEAG